MRAPRPSSPQRDGQVSSWLSTPYHFSHRDLNQTELAELEVLIDAAGIEAVIQSLSEICGLKADHIAANWQDTALAKRWATLEGALGVASTKATGL
jgi:hypothetical protein